MTLDERANPGSCSFENRLENIVEHLRVGYYPYFDERNVFVWERQPTRSIIVLDDVALGKATRLKRKVKNRTTYIIAENKSFDRALRDLADPMVKPNTWVRGKVLEVYRMLHEAGYAKTIEAYVDGGLAAAVLGIEVGRVFVIETHLSLLPNASKVALAEVVYRYYERGFICLDVQKQHPPSHPCALLGEKLVTLETYLDILKLNSAP